LGVILDSRMSFAEHVDIEVGKALEMQGFVKRVSRKFRDSYSFKTFYLSLVLLKLEYVRCLWRPFYNVHVRESLLDILPVRRQMSSDLS
jgi:hypothetical protein